MAPATLLEWPASITAGTTVKVSRTFSDFQPPTWSLNVYVNGAVVLGPIAATVDGQGFLVTLTAAQTATLTAGVYTVGEVVTDGTDTYTASSTTITVLPNFATATAGSFQSWAEKTLAVIESVLSGRITDDIMSYQIGNRMVTKIPVDELMKYRTQLKAEVAAKKTGGGSFGAEVRVQYEGI